MEMCDRCPKMFKLLEFKSVHGDEILCEECSEEYYLEDKEIN